jgi:PTH1 family peptidyl-tRNA hydrolase
MNLSGDSVAEALRYLPVEVSDLVVVYDEMDLPAGKLRIRPGGGHGGHNGMRSIIASLGSDAFPRVRVGVGRPEGKGSATGHLLSRMNGDERRWFDGAVALAADAVDAILQRGAAQAMNEFNGRGTGESASA